MSLDHAALIRLGAAWLRGRSRRRCTVVLADFRSVSTTEQPDVIGWTVGGWSVLIEAKTSRSDFKRDANKCHRRSGRAGMGQERYYLAPAGLLTVADLPDGWGFLEAPGFGRVRVVVPSVPKALEFARCRDELPMVLAALRRSLKTGGSLEYVAPLPRRPVVVEAAGCVVHRDPKPDNADAVEAAGLRGAS